MNTELLNENRSKIWLAVISFAVLLVILLLAMGFWNVKIQNMDRKVDELIAGLTYTEDHAGDELALLRNLPEEQFVSVAAKGKVYMAMAEISYMTGDDRIYNRYVGNAKYYLQRSGDQESLFYISNKYIGRLYANGCYSAAVDVLRTLSENNDIASLPVEMQVSYYLSRADIAQMLGSDGKDNLASAQKKLDEMEEGSSRQLDQAKCDMLLVRSLLFRGEYDQARALLESYDEDEDFGLGQDQVYVVCDFKAAYYEMKVRMALYEKEEDQVYSYLDKYLQICDTYAFHCMKLNILDVILADPFLPDSIEKSKCEALEKEVSDENLKIMSNAYGQYLLSDMSGIASSLEEKERQKLMTIHKWVFAVVVIYISLLSCIV